MSTENENINIDNTGSNAIETNSINWTSYSFFNTNQNTSSVSMATLQEYIRYPMIYNAILREISKQAYNANGLYANTVDYMISIPTLSNITIPPKNKSLTKKKKKDFKTVAKLLNLEKTSRDILRSVFLDGMYVGILRDTTASNKNPDLMSGIVDSIDRIEGLSLDDNFMIQSLDNDWVKCIGIQNNISIVCFNMQYFDQFKHGGLVNEIKNFPKDFMKAYMQYKRDASKQWHILDPRKTIAVKFKSSLDEPYGRPLGLSAFADMKFQSDYFNSQFQIVSELASSIYVLTLPQGEKLGTCALNTKQQDAVIEAFKGAVKVNTSGNIAKISTLSLPPNTKIDKVEKDASLLKDTLSDEIIKKISTNLGFASAALNASSEGAASYSSLAVNIDLVSSQIFEVINQIAFEYTRLINEFLGIKPIDYIQYKYLPISWLNKKDMSDKAKDLYLQGRGSLSMWIASSGFDVDDYIAMMDYELEEGWETKYLVHATSFNTDGSSIDNKGGAPEKDKLTPNGEKTKSTGANKTKKPSNKGE